MLKFADFLHLMPAEAVQQPVELIISVLEARYGVEFYKAFESEKFAGPVYHIEDCNWIKVANTVGINVRTLGDFWSVIPYTMTLPAAQNAIHFLPVFEPGVVSSLYGPTSWNINPEFFNARLANIFPQFDTVEKQLSLTIRLLHLLGKSVGLDVIPHVDRFAEQVLANPSLFEWIRRADGQIIDHSGDLHLKVRSKLFNFLIKRGSLLPEAVFPATQQELFDDLPESLRVRMMFGEKHEYEKRLLSRIEMVDLLYLEGLETLPATMGPPYRGIEVDQNPNASIVDHEGRVWRDYVITRPQKFSRVFGPLARYKLYETEENNRNWALDFNKPYKPAWTYACSHYKQIQATFDFDFMRGDMSHVQMRPAGVPLIRDEYYDLLGAVKQSVLPEKPYFGYFAESFLAPPGEMAYGDECDHLEASFADSTLGDLQSEPVGTDRFVQEFHRYDTLLRTRKFAPNFTIMTADKDDPRFDAFYLTGNETRYFIALFLTDMPSYMGLGFECRDPHPVPAPNEHYTKLYVFQEQQGPKSTKGPFIWGGNRLLYENLVRQKVLAAEIFPHIEGSPTKWLIPPDPEGKGKLIAWTQAENPLYVFLANLSNSITYSGVQPPGLSPADKLIFSTLEREIRDEQPENYAIDVLPGECLVWKIAHG